MIRWLSFVRQLSRSTPSIIKQNVYVCMQSLRQWRSHHRAIMASYLYLLLKKKYLFAFRLLKVRKHMQAPLHNGTAKTLLRFPFTHTAWRKAEHNVETMTKSTFLERSYFYRLVVKLVKLPSCRASLLVWRAVTIASINNILCAILQFFLVLFAFSLLYWCFLCVAVPVNAQYSTVNITLLYG